MAGRPHEDSPECGWPALAESTISAALALDIGVSGRLNLALGEPPELRQVSKTKKRGHFRMGKAPIARAVAKQELVRINALVKEPLLLIGGLAVQQYCPSRHSVDIDLVCDSELAYRIVRELYPQREWNVKDDQDEYRPKITATHRINKIKVHFGPKIIERGEYQYLSWTELSASSVPFRIVGDVILDRIRVPASHELAYTKIISFLGRYSNREKSLSDLQDFADLMTDATFSLQGLFDRIGASGSGDMILSNMKRILAEDDDAISIMNSTCLKYFLQMWPEGSALSDEGVTTSNKLTTVYYAAPHKNFEQNSGVASFLSNHGIETILPYDEVLREAGDASPTDSSVVRRVCIDAINRSDGIIVDVDLYGLDTAWEIGYAEGAGKYVIGLNHDPSLRNIPRPANRRPYHENFMHGWDRQEVFGVLAAAQERLVGKSVYMCGPFSNEYIRTVEDQIRAIASRVIFPRDYVPKEAGLPRDYPLRTRENAIHQLENCDVLLVALPRYGMDSSWQIGFATAKGKQVVGLMLPDDHGSGDSKVLWDHWMHGWHDKDVFTGRAKLGAALSAFRHFNIVK